MKILSVLLLSVLSASVWAQTQPGTIPEPETLLLLGLGAAVLLATRRNRK